MGEGLWLAFDTFGFLMRRCGGLSDTSPLVLGTPFGLRISVMSSWVVEEAPSIRGCRLGEGGSGKLRSSALMLRIMRGARLVGDAAWKGA